MISKWFRKQPGAFLSVAFLLIACGPLTPRAEAEETTTGQPAPAPDATAPAVTATVHALASPGDAGATTGGVMPQLPDVDMDEVLDKSPDADSGLKGEVKVDVPASQPKAAVSPPVKPQTVNPNLPPMEFIQKSYKEGRYKDALDKLATIKPQSDKIHYWAGLCYQGQGQLQRAQQEFQWVSSYSKDPRLKYNAALALQAVGRYGMSRSYAGQGNAFSRQPSYSGGGGGGSRASAPPCVPTPTGSG